MLQHLKRLARMNMVPLIYRYPPVGLQPERLQRYLATIIATRDVPGAVIEVGCNLGGTSIVASTMMRRLGIDKPYYCIDTFDGFVGEQFDRDVSLGTPESYRHIFSGNSVELVRRITGYHGCADIRLIKKDCTKIDADDVPEGISVCLLDVDLSDPVRRGLQRIWPLTADGGVILVDDCPEEYNWKARIGLEEFCRDEGLSPQYEFGLGLLRKAPRAESRELRRTAGTDANTNR